MKVNYYDFGMRLPVYDTSIDIGNTLKKNLENYLLYKQDEMEHKTNVKATMTNWTTHKTNAEFKALSDIVLMCSPIGHGRFYVSLMFHLILLI
jgi:hypothetical protein